MKYKELKKVAREKGYEIETNDFRTILKKQDLENNFKGEIIISEIDSWNIDLSTSLWFPHDFKLLEAVLAYAKTPLEERYDKKRYYLKHKFLFSGTNNYLNYVKSTKGRTLSNKSQNNYVQTQFTQKEINEIKEKYHTDLKDFEIIEVEE